MNTRNIFTLGNFPSKRRQPVPDPFERDPFKIQSYNFHYADRPSYPVNIVQPKLPQQKTQKDCQTFFYNYDFNRSNKCTTVPSFPLKNVEPSLNLTKFQETRRKKFLQDLWPYRNTQVTTTTTKENSLNLNYKTETIKPLNVVSMERSYNSQSLKQNFNITSNSLQKPLPQKTKSIPPALSRAHTSLFLTPRNTRANHRHSSSSCCEININIKNLEHNCFPENLNIKIQTDSISNNLNLPLNKSLNNSKANFVGNKNLSKIPSNSQIKVTDFRKSQSQRIKELTSLYSSQNVRKPINIQYNKSKERLPSLIPFQTQNSSKENSFNKKLSSQKLLQENLKIYDNKATTSSSNNNFYCSPYSSATNGGPKLLNTSTLSKKFNNSRQPPLVSSIHSLPTSSNKKDFKPMAPLRLRTSTQKPLNVNINVYADKLRLIR